MGAVSRNAPCPCGSGLKHKRCCLAAAQFDREQAQLEDAVGTRILHWTTESFADEINDATSEFGRPAAEMSDAEMQIFITWLCSDRELATGGTPSERYAERADLGARERAVAGRIAKARLSLQRVHAIDPGRWIDLEDVFDASRVRVRSAGVSHEVARWDALLCRVMPNEHDASLWGPAVVFGPDEEREVITEIARQAAANGLPTSPADPTTVLRLAGLQLMRFEPPSRRLQPSYYTAEGDALVHGHATWSVTDAPAVFEQLNDPPELAWVGESEDGTGEAFQWTVDRAQRLAGRPSLPPGAVCFESHLTELPGRLNLATFELAAGQLRCSAISEARLDAAIELVADRIGHLTKLQERAVAAFEPDAVRERGRTPSLEPPAGLSRQVADELERELINDHFRRWLDQPLQPLDGATPREAAKGRQRGELERLLRGIENRSERTRRKGTPWPDLYWLREELGLEAGELAA